MITHINDDEELALSGIPLMAQIIYIRGIKRYMDSDTLITGLIRKISYQSLIETVYVEPKQGRSLEPKPTIKKIRVMLKNLIDSGLLQSRSKDRQLVFFCPLANTHYSAQKKQGRARAEQGQSYQGRTESTKYAVYTNNRGRCEDDQKQQKKGIHLISISNTQYNARVSGDSVDNFTESAPGFIPDDFCVTEEHRAMAKMMGAPPPDELVDEFIGHHQAMMTRAYDFNALFRKWMANARNFREMNKKTNGGERHEGNQSGYRSRGTTRREHHERISQGLKEMYKEAFGPNVSHIDFF